MKKRIKKRYVFLSIIVVFFILIGFMINSLFLNTRKISKLQNRYKIIKNDDYVQYKIIYKNKFDFEYDIGMDPHAPIPYIHLRSASYIGKIEINKELLDIDGLGNKIPVSAFYHENNLYILAENYLDYKVKWYKYHNKKLTLLPFNEIPTQFNYIAFKDNTTKALYYNSRLFHALEYDPNIACDLFSTYAEMNPFYIFDKSEESTINIYGLSNFLEKLIENESIDKKKVKGNILKSLEKIFQQHYQFLDQFEFGNLADILFALDRNKGKEILDSYLGSTKYKKETNYIKLVRKDLRTIEIISKGIFYDFEKICMKNGYKFELFGSNDYEMAYIKYSITNEKRKDLKYFIKLTQYRNQKKPFLIIFLAEGCWQDNKEDSEEYYEFSYNESKKLILNNELKDFINSKLEE